MRYLKFTALIIVCLLFVGGFAQKTGTAGAGLQKKNVPAGQGKTTTADPNKKALNQFSKDKMYAPSAPPAKPLGPQETRAKALYDEGAKKGKAGDYNGAIADFSKSLDVVKNASTYVKRGWAYQMVGNFASAIQDANEALKLQPALARAGRPGSD